MASLLSMAHFWGLKTDPEALALHRVSNINGLFGFVVVMDVCPSPVTMTEEFSSIARMAHAVMLVKDLMTCRMFVRCRFAPVSLWDSGSSCSTLMYPCDSSDVFSVSTVSSSEQGLQMSMSVECSIWSDVMKGGGGGNWRSSGAID